MSAKYRLYTDSLENVPVPVDATLHGAKYDPTGDVVKMAFIPLDQAEPGSGDWNVASWDTLGSGVTVQYVALCLVGPGGVIELAPGTYQVFVKVTDNPEIPVKQAENLLFVV